MLLTRLKELREQRNLTLRELADKSHVPYSAISLLENGKREPQGRTARKLAGALGVEVVELYEQAQPVKEIAQPTNDNKTITPAKPARSTSRAKVKQPAVCFWIFENQEDGEPFKADTRTDAERLQARLGGQHQARVYQAASKFEAWELHRQFMVKVARGHDAW